MREKSGKNNLFYAAGLPWELSLLLLFVGLFCLKNLKLDKIKLVEAYHLNRSSTLCWWHSEIIFPLLIQLCKTRQDCNLPCCEGRYYAAVPADTTCDAENQMEFWTLLF
jgi:hypothetical protein